MLGTAEEVRTNSKFSYGLQHMDTRVDRPERTYTHQFNVDTGCRQEDLLRTMNDTDR